MIELLDELQKKADSFKPEEGQVLGIFVYVIGYFLMPQIHEAVEGLMKSRDYELEQGHCRYDSYTLTTIGQVIRLS